MHTTTSIIIAIISTFGATHWKFKFESVMKQARSNLLLFFRNITPGTFFPSEPGLCVCVGNLNVCVYHSWKMPVATKIRVSQINLINNGLPGKESAFQCCIDTVSSDRCAVFLWNSSLEFCS